jgi:alpha,alpha-trehalase
MLQIARRFAFPLLGLALLAATPAPARQTAPIAPALASPSELFGELFARVQTERLFADNKTFADAVPKRAPAIIMAAYRAERPTTPEALRAFVTRYFDLPPTPPARALPPLPLREHIAALWPMLIRPPLVPPRYGSALPLDHPYVVPGGRFREIYYWDSYFTMLGLVRDGQQAAATAMVDDFAAMIDRYGHIPNGSRTYYLSRSQPPFFYLMAGLLAEDEGAAYARYLKALKREHAFWMLGAAGLKPGEAAHHSVRLADGTLLNRYWDERDTPRDESYAEDVALAKASGRPAPQVYRDLRAAAESGWDFSSRWFADGVKLGSIETTSLVPVDLNSLLYGLEQAIAEGCRHERDTACTRAFTAQAETRAAAIKRHLWNAQAGAFEDLNWRIGQQTGRLSVATLYPLFVGLADRAQADAVAATTEARLLRPGGIATTTVATGQQWDEPNGWAPLQWIAVAGLDRYGHEPLADKIAVRWVGSVASVYACTQRLVEKYDVDKGLAGGGGEYPVQDGFGWTNGVTRAFLDRAPSAPTGGTCG